MIFSVNKFLGIPENWREVGRQIVHGIEGTRFKCSYNEKITIWRHFVPLVSSLLMLRFKSPEPLLGN